MSMTTDRDLDGGIGQGWGGVSPNGAHANVVLARRGSPTAAALVTAFTSPAPGHTPVLVCVGPDQASYEAVMPPTIMMNKATAVEERHQTMTWGAAQLGIGQGVLDAVADGLLEADRETIVLVAIWIDAAASDETAVRLASREAMRAAVGEAVNGPDPAAAARLVRDRGALANPFYGGE
jgi:formaldehyde-activating enzyme